MLGSKKKTFSDLRRALKQELQCTRLFDGQLFTVWISEDGTPADGTTTSWEHCEQQARDADVVLVLYNGNSGGAKPGDTVGICHAELQAALTAMPSKVRLIEIRSKEHESGPANELDKRFQRYVKRHDLFRGRAVETWDEVIRESKRLLLDVVTEMVHVGASTARSGSFQMGGALDWSRRGYVERRAVIEETLSSTLLGRVGAFEEKGSIFVPVGGELVLFVCHGIPDGMGVARAREMIGQPFLLDYIHADTLTDRGAGPVHIIGSMRNVTEAQARNQLGFPDATILPTAFGIYVVDNIQKIQIMFIANCRDETSTQSNLQAAFAWLERQGEDSLLGKRAVVRTDIVRAIASGLQV